MTKTADEMAVQSGRKTATQVAFRAYQARQRGVTLEELDVLDKREREGLAALGHDE